MTTLTKEGQLTLPREIMDQLDLKPLDRIEIALDGKGGARLRKARPPLRELMGSLPANGLRVEDAMERAEEELADDLAAEYLPGGR